MQNNTTVMANAFLEASTDFQQRVPDPSQHSVAQVAEFLFKPMNKKYLNEFMDIFVNRIAGELIRQRTFTNPLKRKREDILYGTTIQEIELDFIKAHAYRDDLHQPHGASRRVHRRVRPQRACGEDHARTVQFRRV